MLTSIRRNTTGANHGAHRPSRPRKLEEWAGQRGRRSQPDGARRGSAEKAYATHVGAQAHGRSSGVGRRKDLLVAHAWLTRAAKR